MLSIASLGLSAAGAWHYRDRKVLSRHRRHTGDRKSDFKRSLRDKVAAAIQRRLTRSRREAPLIREHEAKSGVGVIRSGPAYVMFQQYHASWLSLVRVGSTPARRVHEQGQSSAGAGGSERRSHGEAHFSAMPASDTLRKFLKPDGATIDKTHEKALKAWMTEHKNTK